MAQRLRWVCKARMDSRALAMLLSTFCRASKLALETKSVEVSILFEMRKYKEIRTRIFRG